MAAFNEEHLIYVVWNTWEELHHNSEAIASYDFTAHVVALDDAWTGNRRKVYTEFERHFAHVLDEEFL